MNYSEFTLATKSTLDYHIKKLADQKGLGFIDLDVDLYNAELAESDAPAFCWEFANFFEAPIDPLYSLEFDVGVRATKDPAQYMSLAMAGEVKQLFRPSAIFTIMDYSKVAAPLLEMGKLYIANSAVAPMQGDRIVGLRFVSVSARAVRVVG